MAVPVLAGFGVNDTQTGTTVSVNVPAGAAEGDLLIAWYSTGRPIGNTVLHPSFTDSGLGDIAHTGFARLAYRKVQSTDASSYTFEFAQTGGPVAGLILITGADGDDPFDGTPSLGTSPAISSAPICPDHTTTGADRLILLLDHVQSSNTVALATEDAGYPSGSTGIWHKLNTASGGNRAVNGAAYKTQASAGATGTNAFAIDNNRSWIGITAAIKPAGAVAPPPAAFIPRMMWI